MDIRIVDGRLVKDAEVKTNRESGNKFLSFTLANNGFSKGSQVTTFFNIISYNVHDIEHYDRFTKGKLVVVSGRPSETMSIKENKTYLNRNIIADRIESGTPNNVTNNQQQTYRDVAPVGSGNVNVTPVTVETPYVAQVSVQPQKLQNPIPVQTIPTQMIPDTEPAIGGFYSEMPSNPNIGVTNDSDDLPF